MSASGYGDGSSGYGDFFVNLSTDNQCERGTARRVNLESDLLQMCYNCSAGYYAPIRGMPACLQCSPGTFQDQRGQTACKPCDVGSFSSDDGLSECQPCRKGYYADAIGGTRCWPCEPGFYNRNPGQAECTGCLPGRYQNSSGQTGCRKCSPGSAAPEPDLSRCERCEVGYVSNAEGLETCEPCQPGWVAMREGMTGCVECWNLYWPEMSTPILAGVNCVTDDEVLVRLFLVAVGMLLLWVVLPSVFFWRVGIDDVYVESAGGQKRIIIRTLRAHWLSSWAGRRMVRKARSPRVVNLDRVDSTKTSATEKSLTLENNIHISVNNRVVVPVDFAQTGHPFLDTQASKKPKEGWSMNAAAARAINAAYDLVEKVSPLKVQEGGSSRPLVQPLTRDHLLLLTPEGKPEERVIETSMGYIRIYFPSTLVRVAPLHVPLILWMVIALLLIVVPPLIPPGYWQEADLDPQAIYVPQRFLLVCGVLSFVAALLLGLICWLLTPTTQRQLKIKEHARELERANPLPERCGRGPERAVQAGQLWRFFLSFETMIRQQRSMYYVVSNLLLPLTSKRRLSYAELAGPHRVTWFVSHFWGTSFRHFVHSVRKHAQSVAYHAQTPWQDPTYWICSFSNNQWEVEAEVGKTWEDSSFFLTLDCTDCVGTAMILDDEAMPLTRAWCLFEVLHTKEIQNKRPDFEGLWLCTSTGVLHEGKAGVDVALHLAKRLSTLRLEDATASVQKDKDMIDHLVSQMPGGFEAMNRFVKSNIAEALRHMNEAFKKEFNQIMGSLGEEPASKEWTNLETETVESQAP